MKELKDLVVGDKVVAYDKYDNRRIAIVERITKTLVVVSNIKYRKSNGLQYGVSSYILSRRIEIPKDEDMILKSFTRMRSIYVGYITEWCVSMVKAFTLITCTDLPRYSIN